MFVLLFVLVCELSVFVSCHATTVMAILVSVQSLCLVVYLFVSVFCVFHSVLCHRLVCVLVCVCFLCTSGVCGERHVCVLPATENRLALIVCCHATALVVCRMPWNVLTGGSSSSSHNEQGDDEESDEEAADDNSSDDADREATETPPATQVQSCTLLRLRVYTRHSTVQQTFTSHG